MNAVAVPVQSNAARMNALVPTSMSEAMHLAEIMSKANLLPDHLRGKPGDCITIRNDNGDIIAEVAASSEISVVAGARFGLYLTEPWRVIILRSQPA